MKFEIEITDEELKSAVERKVRTAIAEKTNGYWADNYIKDLVKERWAAAAEAPVEEALKDSQALKEKIAVEIEKKLRAQLAAALRN